MGAQASTGYIAVEYPPDPARRVVADFGEKSNPVEVRLDPDACRLYVKANGSPLFTDHPPMSLLSNMICFDVRKYRARRLNRK